MYSELLYVGRLFDETKMILHVKYLTETLLCLLGLCGLFVTHASRFV